jgi:ubiquinone/menaquinone biosynthesis C-methylase UbiE
MKIFQETFLTHSRLTILDVGGGMFNWRLLPEPPLDLTIVNIHLPSAQDCGVPWVVADGRHLPFRDHSFDIVFCNSVIEHLGTLENQKLFAKECQRVAKSYYVQTPNKRFPIEPHFLTPYYHYLPKFLQKKLVHYTLWAIITKPSIEDAIAVLEEIRLLDRNELQTLFPDAEIWEEKVVGLTKSLIAVRKQHVA